MTEDQIESMAERAMDALDARLIGGRLTQAEYDARVKALNEWAEAEHAKRRASLNYWHARRTLLEERHG